MSLSLLDEQCLLSIQGLTDAGLIADVPSIMKLIEQATGRPLPQSGCTVYNSVQRLEVFWYVRACYTDPQPVRGGRRKKHFVLLPEGRTALIMMRDIRGRLLAP